MALVSILPEMKKALKGAYGIPLYDTWDSNSTDAMIMAFEEQRAPGIIAMYSRSIHAPNARATAAYIRTRMEESPMPLSLMLDHGASFEECILALRLGFTDVMLDFSARSVEENISATKMVVQAAHAVGAAAEAELGHVGIGSEYQEFGSQRKGFTDPAMVERFVAETGVDMLAIAIGTAHGVYAGEPHLDMDLLKEIRSRVDIPLVLHGGSGLSDAQFRGVIAHGISKVNVATDLAMSAAKKMVALAKDEKANYMAFGKTATDTIKERCSFYLDLFGATGKA